MSSRYSKETNSTVGYVRNRDIDVLRHQELVMQLAQAKEEVTRADVVELLHVTPPKHIGFCKSLKTQENCHWKEKEQELGIT